jgi:hypothetical protein
MCQCHGRDIYHGNGDRPAAQDVSLAQVFDTAMRRRSRVQSNSELGTRK